MCVGRSCKDAEPSSSGGSSGGIKSSGAKSPEEKLSVSMSVGEPSPGTEGDTYEGGGGFRFE
jgi:hypothetical protein